MIAFPDLLPRVLWQNGRLVPLSEGWLSESLEESAKRAGMKQWPWTQQVARAIVHHLEEACDAMTISEEEMNAILRATLTGIGCEEIAKEACLAAPRVSIYLPDLARQSAHEMIFFQALNQRLVEAARLQVNGVRLEGVRECVKILDAAVKWRHTCEALRDEIVTYARILLQQSASPRMELLIC